MQTYIYNGLGGIAYGAVAEYGTLNLTVSSPPQSFTEPLSLGEVKAYLNLPARSPSDQDEDSLLLTLISAAREQAEILQGRDLVRKQWDMSLDYFTRYQIDLRAPLVGVDLVQYKDVNANVTVLQENRNYIVDLTKQPGLIAPLWNTTWPTFTAWPSSAILIRFRSGYLATDPWWSDAGARVKVGMKMLISHWFEDRLPFEYGLSATAEYPYAVTACLSYGGIMRAR